jgi:8-oxo-dGTP pyrophosphatase MutT (NUDIX family)
LKNKKKRPVPLEDERFVHEGNILSVVNQNMQVGDKQITFEKVRRSPGVRLIITQNEKLLLSREFRHETKSYDYRLPGGKVFDSFTNYKKSFLDKVNLKPYVIDAAKKEAVEEVGIQIKNPEIIHKSISGATIDWSLYYVLVEEFEETSDGQDLEAGEDISLQWVTSDELKQLISKNQFGEDRSIGVLYKYGYLLEE